MNKKELTNIAVFVAIISIMVVGLILLMIMPSSTDKEKDSEDAILEWQIVEKGQNSKGVYYTVRIINNGYADARVFTGGFTLNNEMGKHRSPTNETTSIFDLKDGMSNTVTIQFDTKNDGTLNFNMIGYATRQLN